ncbi:hypothetical protein CENSYa_0429 [Cenarchaeum symbiosum A]|uniref:Uncharacterized protein n=1 Tax=Cenarchaeum symbiosum (strain A) TaxID=414004 RepID=A0RUP7_CENSY|nr:hypothetical protein CENSYa_0429 [Cenarchaeum symbiosum A]
MDDTGQDPQCGSKRGAGRLRPPVCVHGVEWRSGRPHGCRKGGHQRYNTEWRDRAEPAHFERHEVLPGEHFIMFLGAGGACEIRDLPDFGVIAPGAGLCHVGDSIASILEGESLPADDLRDGRACRQAPDRDTCLVPALPFELASLDACIVCRAPHPNPEAAPMNRNLRNSIRGVAWSGTWSTW